MSFQATGGNSAVERARIEAILARYPDVSESELSRLKHWFERVATPLDFGMLASDPAVSERYRAYRKDHHDRLKIRDIGLAAIMLGMIAAVIGVIIILKP